MAIGESGFAACPPTHVLFAQTVDSPVTGGWRNALPYQREQNGQHRRIFLPNSAKAIVEGGDSLRRFAWNFPLTASQNARLGHRRNILDSNELRLFDRSLSSSSVLEPRGFDRFNPHPCLYCRNSCFANFRHRGHLLSRHLGYCKTPGDRCPIPSLVHTFMFCGRHRVFCGAARLLDKIDALPYRVLKHFSRQCQSLCVSSQ